MPAAGRTSWSRRPRANCDVDLIPPTSIETATPDLVSIDGGIIAWHENAAGDGSSWTSHSIDSIGGIDIFSVDAADVDGDGDTDLLVTEPVPPPPAAVQETRGDGSSWVVGDRSPTAASSTPEIVSAADIDGDGDLDAISASVGDNKIAWYENVGGASTLRRRSR